MIDPATSQDLTVAGSSPSGKTSPKDAFLGSVLSAAAITTAGVLFGMLLGGIRQVTAARGLGPIDYGAIGLAESFENVLIRVAPLGLVTSIPLLLSRARAAGDDVRAGGILGTGLLLGIGVAVAAGVGLSLLAAPLTGLLDASRAEETLQVWGIVVAALAATQLAGAGLQGMLRMPAATVTRDVVPSALLLLGLVGALVVGLGGGDVAWGYALGATAAAMVALGVLAWVAAHSGLQLRISAAEAWPLLSLSLPVMTMVVSGQLIRQLNTPILAATANLGVVGVFSAAFFLSSTVEAVFLSLTFVYMPYATRLLVERGGVELGGMQSAVGRWTYLLTLLPATVLFAGSETILTWLFGPAYGSGSVALRILLLGVMVQALVGPRNPVLLALGNARSVMVNFLVSLAAAAAISASLVPFLGMAGAALSIATALAVRALVSQAQLARRLAHSGLQRRDLYLGMTMLPCAAGIMLGEEAAVAGAAVGALLAVIVLVATIDLEDRAFLRLLGSRIPGLKERMR